MFAPTLSLGSVERTSGADKRSKKPRFHLSGLAKAPVMAFLGCALSVGWLGAGQAQAQNRTVIITAASDTVPEGSGGGRLNADFRVSLSGPASVNSSIDVVAVPGTGSTGAQVGSDYDDIGRITVNFPAGTSGPFTVSVPIVGDDADEPNETFSLRTVAGSATGGISTTASATATETIIDDDNPPVITIDNPTVTEGTGTNSTVTFTVSLSQASGQEVRVNYATATDPNSPTNSAQSPSDFQARSGTLIIPAGATEGTVTVTVIGDSVDEGSETFALNLTNAVNADLASDQGIATIFDDDGPRVTISDVTLNEGSNFVFTVTLSAPSPETITVNYQTRDAGAVGGLDYTPASGTLTFFPGTTNKDITVQTIDDNLVENSENFTVNLSGASGGVIIDDSQGLGTIIDNENTPTLTVQNATTNEGNSGQQPLTFVATLSAPSSQQVSFRYRTADGNGSTTTDPATSGNDYLNASGTVTFNPGETRKTFQVIILGDTVDERDETFNVIASSPIGASFSGGTTATAIGTIIDDDGPIVSILTPPAITEGARAARPNITFTLRLSKASPDEVGVTFATSDGTATARLDYTPKTTKVTFAPGVTSINVPVQILGDDIDEPNETFTASITAPVNATISATQDTATATINDDDNTPVVGITSSVTSQKEATSTYAFQVTLTGASSNTITVDYTTVAGSATADVDFSSQSGTVTFAPGTLVQTIRIPILADNIDENDESFTVVLSNPTNANVTPSTATGIIVDDDATPQLSINNQLNVPEGQANAASVATFTATLNRPSGLDVSFNVATVEPTTTLRRLRPATEGSDYTPVSTRLTIPAGQTSVEVPVTIKGDTLDEYTEYFLVRLSQPTNATINNADGTGSITDDDAEPTLTIAAPAADETAIEGGRFATFTATLSVVTGRDVRIAYELRPFGNTAPANTDPSNNTPGNPLDVAPVDSTGQARPRQNTGTVTIPAGSLSADFRVAGLRDDADETLLEQYAVAITNVVPTADPSNPGADENAGTNVVKIPAQSVISSTVEDRNAGFADFTTTVGTKKEGNQRFATNNVNAGDNSTVVIITGNQFRVNGVRFISAVYFGVIGDDLTTGTATSALTYVDDNTFTVRVPNGAHSGKLRLVTTTGVTLTPTNPNDPADSSRDDNFYVNPVVTGFNPVRGVERNTVVDIQGLNLNDPLNPVTGVRFNGLASTARNAGIDPVRLTDSNGQTFYRATVPSGATSGPISFLTGRTGANYPDSTDDFTVDQGTAGGVEFVEATGSSVLENSTGTAASPLVNYTLRLTPAKNAATNVAIPPRGDVTVQVTIADDVPTGSRTGSPIITNTDGRLTTKTGTTIEVLFPAGSLQSTTISLIDAGDDIIKPDFTNTFFQAQNPRLLTLSAFIVKTADAQLYPTGSAANADKRTIERLDIHGLDTDINTVLRTTEDQDSSGNTTSIKVNLRNINNGVIVGTDGVGVTTNRFSAKPQPTVVNPDGTVNTDAEPKADVNLPFVVSAPDEAQIRYYTMVPVPNQPGKFVKTFPLANQGGTFGTTANVIYATSPSRPEYYKYDHYLEVKGVDDTIRDEDQRYTVSLDNTATQVGNSTDPEFKNLDLVTPFNLVNSDNEQSGNAGEPGFIFSPRTGNPAAVRLTTNEGGGQAIFTAVLRTKPTTGKVTLRLMSGNPAEVGLVNPKNTSEIRPGQDYIFYADARSSYQANETLWNRPITIRVAGLDDDEDDDDQVTSLITSTYDPGTSDPAYRTIDPEDIIVTNQDNEDKGVTVLPTTLIIDEGANDTFSVRLNIRPSNGATVIIPLRSSDPSIATISTPTGLNRLTFNTSNYNVPQVIKVTAVDDGAFTPERITTIRIDAPQGDDANFAGVDPVDVNVRVQNSTSAFVVTPASVPTSGLSTSEDGGTDTFQVRLSQQPAAGTTVKLTLATSNSAEVLLSGGGKTRASNIDLTFDANNFATTQNVIVTGVDDTLKDGNKTVTINGTVSSTDANYAQQGFTAISVVNIDNDSVTAGGAITFAPNSTYSVSFPFAIGSAADKTLTVSQAFSLLSGSGTPQFTLYKFNVTGQRNSRSASGTDFVALKSTDTLIRGIGYKLVTGNNTIRLNTRAQIGDLSVYPAKYTEFPITLNWNANFMSDTSSPNNTNNGYNFIGFPFDPNNYNRVPFASSKVQYGSAVYNTVAEAAAAGIMDQKLYTMDADGNLTAVSSSDLFLRPYRGYFVRILRHDQPIILTLRNPTT